MARVRIAQVKTVGVVGAGTMGHGVAWVSALAGYETRMFDEFPDALEAGRQKILKGWERSIEKGRLTPESRDAALSRLKTTGSLDDLKDCDLIVEAVPEDIDLKRRVFSRLDALARSEAVLATNTSSLSITQIASAVRSPGRVVGVHFMNPVPVLELVELVRGLETGEEAAAAARRWAESLGKTVVEVRDAPGFISNRILMPMINEAVFALSEGVASAEDIDRVMKLGMGHPIGPLALSDLVGLDVCLSVLEVLHREFGDPKYRPCPLLRRMVAAGWLGRKTGRGFYSYPG
ncbi:MAG: 3-hydroxybutyryl-CoA dehydrogenase [Candidatus Tectomicrobia bacterium]|nr:3-hydroxybutyryl-CoA dehydrogenase [Candidatus Tectomicrobia bacterium]